MEGAPLAGAVDLAPLKEGLGPREAGALRDELVMMARTREMALRNAVVLEAENEGLNRALAVMVYMHGVDDGAGKRYVTIDHAAYHDAMERIAAVSIDPGSSDLHLVVTLNFDGEWTVYDREPTEDELDRLPVFETLPDVVTRPDSWQAIVRVGAKLAVAEWTPA